MSDSSSGSSSGSSYSSTSYSGKYGVYNIHIHSDGGSVSPFDEDENTAMTEALLSKGIHVGVYKSHPKSCKCFLSSQHCDRGKSAWTCCGAVEKTQPCTYPDPHPSARHQIRFPLRRFIVDRSRPEVAKIAKKYSKKRRKSRKSGANAKAKAKAKAKGSNPQRRKRRAS